MKVHKALAAAKPAASKAVILAGIVNASADRFVASLTETSIKSAIFFSSFYSSQGRQTSFPDHNSDLIEQLQTEIKDLATLEVSLLGSFYILLFTGDKFCFYPFTRMTQRWKLSTCIIWLDVGVAGPHPRQPNRLHLRLDQSGQFCPYPRRRYPQSLPSY